MKKIAFITGITGQDGSYLAELLLSKNYIVHGLLRRTSVLNVERIQSIINKYEKKGKLNLHYMDLTDTSSITNLIKKFKPDEFYNLAAMSHVGISFYTGEATLNINTLASYRILESILKNHKNVNFIKLLRVKCLDQHRCRKMRKVHLIHKVHMEFQRFQLSIQLSILGRLTDYLLLMVFYSIMNHLEEV